MGREKRADMRQFKQEAVHSILDVKGERDWRLVAGGNSVDSQVMKIKNINRPAC